MNRCKNLRALSLGAMLTIPFFSSTASAVVVDSIGEGFSVYFNGIVGEVEQPGLTANAVFTLTDIEDLGGGEQNWIFSVMLNNTSVYPPISDSRVSVLGFDTNPDADADESTVTGVFSKVAEGAVSGSSMTLELCFKDGGGSNNCAGGGNGGVLQGDSGNFIASLNFDSSITQLDLTNFYVRYQSIEGSDLGTSGYGEEIPAVPLPAAGWLLASALAGLLATRRKQTLQ